MTGDDGTIGAELTPREREVLSMVAAGLTNREIGEALFISESTAGVHVSNMMAKLGVGSRTEAAAMAVRAGLVDPTSAPIPDDEPLEAEPRGGERPRRRWLALGVGTVVVLLSVTAGLAIAVFGSGRQAASLPSASASPSVAESASPFAAASPDATASPSPEPSASATPVPTATPIPFPIAVLTVEWVRNLRPASEEVIVCVTIKNAPESEAGLYYAESQFSARNTADFVFPTVINPYFLSVPLMSGELRPGENRRGELPFVLSPQTQPLTKLVWNLGIEGAPEVVIDLPAPGLWDGADLC